MASLEISPMLGADANDWHAIHIRHQHEKTVADVLTRERFEIFLPLYSTVRPWKDRMKHLWLPLFPCYAFFRGGLDRKLQIVQTPGVHGIVGTAGRAAVIPEEEIAAIRRAVDGRLKVEPYPYLKAGDRVRITAGPLLGIEGILIRKQDLARIVLSIEMLGRSVAVEVNPAFVEPISSGAHDRSPGSSAPPSGIERGIAPVRNWSRGSR
jgi:transcription termination/antitermination protein NusG